MIQEEKTKIKEFTDLKVWQEARELAVLIYAVTRQFPKEEVFGLTSQMRRAGVSIASNIAEGFGRQGYKEKIQFYYLSQGSLTELKNQCIIANDIDYLGKEDFDAIILKLITTHQLLQGLIKKSKSFLNHAS